MRHSGRLSSRCCAAMRTAGLTLSFYDVSRCGAYHVGPRARHGGINGVSFRQTAPHASPHHNWPLALFWPLRRRVLVWRQDAQGRRVQQLDRTALALCLVGWSIPLAYLGFGITQVFFAHNSDNLFYLFMLMLVHSALQAQQRQAAAGQGG